MSDPIGPCDYVEFIGPREVPFLMPPIGSLHVVRAIAPHPVRCPKCGSLAFILVQRSPVFICEALWRPIYRPKPDAFADLLKIPELETQS